MKVYALDVCKTEIKILEYFKQIEIMTAIEFLRDKKILSAKCTKFIVTFSDSENDESFDFVELMEEYKKL